MKYIDGFHQFGIMVFCVWFNHVLINPSYHSAPAARLSRNMVRFLPRKYVMRAVYFYVAV